jgi:hypothetical protein
MQPFFKRDGLKQIKVKQNRGSIRSNFEQMDDESDDEMKNRKTSPGPGAYQTMTSTFNATALVDRPKSI